MSIKIYLDANLPNYADLEIELINENFILCIEDEANVFIRYGENRLENEKHPFSIYNDKCRNNNFEKTVFLHWFDWSREYKEMAQYFNPENRYLFNPTFCFQQRLPIRISELLINLSKF